MTSLATHESTPREALSLLLRKVAESDESLAAKIQLAIDSGKDIEEEAPTTGKRKKSRRYRKAIRLSDEEALREAVRVLQNFFVEQPLFATATMDNFKMAGLAEPQEHNSKDGAQPNKLDDVGVDKAIEIELGAETQIALTGNRVHRVERIESSLITEQQRHITRLLSLISFNVE